MDTFQASLDAYLERGGITESALAETIGRSQAAIHRYRKGTRFPDADTARELDKQTHGAVPFALWHSEFLKRSGIAA